MGGLARKATILDGIKSNGQTLFVVDAGNLFFKGDNISTGTAAQIQKVNSEIILKAFNEMGCDCINLGSHDFAAGLDYLKTLESDANFPFISANIRGKDGRVLFKPFEIVYKDGISMGLIGLSSVFTHPDIVVLDPLPVLNDIIEEVKSKSDVVILLFHASDSDIARLKNQSSQVDMVLQSKSRRRSNDGGDGKIPVFSAGDRGKYLYQFDFNVSSPGEPFVDLSTAMSEIEYVKKKLRKYGNGNPNANFDELFKDDPTKLSDINNLLKRKTAAEAVFSSAKNSMALTKIELGKRVADKPEVLKIIDEGKNEIRIMQTPTQAPIIPRVDPRIGN